MQDDGKKVDVYLKFYDEYAALARQHETQRERMTSIFIPASAVLFGIIAHSQFATWTLPLASLLLALGVFGFFFSGKHYERFRFATSLMHEFSDEIDRILLAEDSNRTIRDIRASGERKHYSSFTWHFKATNARRTKSRSWLGKARLHTFWEMIHLAIFLLGAIAIALVFAFAWMGPSVTP